jgi:ABC-2 type transport system ATP-binding protein
VGSVFRTVDQDGKVWADKDYPAKASDFLKGTGSGALDLLADGGAGPLTGGAKPGDVIGAAVTGITPARATRAVNVALTATTSAMALGAPKLTVTYTGTPGSGSLPTRVFAQLIDETKGVVIGNQITPIPVTLDGTAHTATFDLEIIAQQLKAGDKLTLQITPTTVAYRQPQLGGKITFSNIQVRVPLVTTLTDAAGAGSVT